MFTPPQLELPFRIKNYILTNVIGHGGFGTVYRAASTNYNDYEFAVKVMKIPERVDEKHLAHILSLESEVSALKKLDHPNMIRLYDFFREKEHVFLVLELCTNGTLDEKIAKLSYKEKLKICSDIANGLKYCHENSFAHRDIKTVNILFDMNNRVKIADFGLSQFLVNKNQKTSKAEGSLNYISPEIIIKADNSPIKSDIWSFGVLIFRVFCNCYPFTGQDKREVMKNIRNCVYSSIKIPGELNPIVTRMLKMNPDERLTINKVCEMLNNLVSKYKLSTHRLRTRMSHASLPLGIHPMFRDIQLKKVARKSHQLSDLQLKHNINVTSQPPNYFTGIRLSQTQPNQLNLHMAENNLLGGTPLITSNGSCQRLNPKITSPNLNHSRFPLLQQTPGLAPCLLESQIIDEIETIDQPNNQSLSSNLGSSNKNMSSAVNLCIPGPTSCHLNDGNQSNRCSHVVFHHLESLE
ncbi:CAMK family protein kinase [Tritrichomonas foetus]|uniref:CAMK family protein kinase n=1 Tax=Tritrichomonas foetus TaxID=1144522 RepID=A0A1J4JT61_9EUKA|nr:CAMK family protein kinase [Tritrichomonas foetus]|eukprot:OHT02259.1 CAMK family protein kinase [Tritrichomonas foetus]